MHRRFLPLFLVIGFALLPFPGTEAAAQMSWTVHSRDGRTVALRNENQARTTLSLFSFRQDVPREATADRRKIDWRGTSLRGVHGPLSIRIGLQSPEKDRLIVRAGSRRGIALEIGAGPEAPRLTAFVLRQRETADSPEMLGVRDGHNRMFGARLDLNPGEGWTGVLPRTVEAVIGPGGSCAWSVASERNFSNRFHLETEVAGSTSPAASPESALALRGRLSTLARLTFAPVCYRLVLHWKRVEAGFSSPGYQGQENNMENAGLQGRLSWRAFAMQATVGERRKNADGLPGLPEETIRQVSLSLTVPLGGLLPTGSRPFFLKHPKGRFSHRAIRRRATSWDGPVISGSDENATGFSLQAGTVPFSWEFDFVLVDLNDLFLESCTSRRWALRAHLGPRAIQVSPFVHLSTTRMERGEESNEMTTGVAGRFRPKAPWRGSLTFSLNHRQKPECQNDSFRIQGDVGWSGAATRSHPAVEVSLSGRYQTSAVETAQETSGTEEGRVLLSLKVSLPS